jgi:hypothetical protein
MVAVAAGSMSRHILLKAVRAMPFEAVVASPERANLMGFKALTKPRRMKKMATHE